MGIKMIEVAELLELKLLNKFKKRVLELREELKWIIGNVENVVGIVLIVLKQLNVRNVGGLE